MLDDGQRLAAHALGFFREPLEERRRVGDLGARLGERLPLFTGHDEGEIFAMLEHELEPAAEHGRAFLGRPGAPVGPGCSRGSNGPERVGVSHGGYRGDLLAARGIEDGKRRALCRVDPSPVHVGSGAQQRGVLQWDHRVTCRVCVGF